MGGVAATKPAVASVTAPIESARSGRMLDLRADALSQEARSSLEVLGFGEKRLNLVVLLERK